MCRVAFIVFVCLLAHFLACDAKQSTAFEKLSNRLTSQKCAVATLVYDGDNDFVTGAEVLGYSLQQSRTQMVMVAMVTQNVDENSKARLMNAGWKLRAVDAISNPNPEYFARLEYIFTKMQIYTMTEYERVVYLDADTLVNENVDELCSCNAYHCSVVRNTFFNSGVIVLTPSQEIYNDMLTKYQEMHSYTGGDQGFMNNYFWQPERCPFYEPITDIHRYTVSDVPHTRCYRLPGYYNGDVGVYITRDDSWTFDPDETIVEPKITHYTLSVFKPWSWFSYIVVKYNWKWYDVYSNHIVEPPRVYLIQLLFMVVVAIAYAFLAHRVRITFGKGILKAIMLDKITRVVYGQLQHLITLLFAYWFSTLSFVSPTCSIILFYITYCVMFDIICVTLWEKYWDAAVGTKTTINQTITDVHRAITCVSMGLLIIVTWTNVFFIYGRILSMVVWLFVVPGVAHTVFYQIAPILPK